MNRQNNNGSRGLTPAQIKKAVQGKKAEVKLEVLQPLTRKPQKPEKAVRQHQKGDNGLLLNLPFSTTHSTVQYATPDWFTYTQKAEVSVVVPLVKSTASALIKAWDLSCEGFKVELIFVEDGEGLKEEVVKHWEARKGELKGPVGKIYYTGMSQGWGACCNIGAEKATGDILVFMHPDTIPVDGWLKPLVRQARKEDTGAVSAAHFGEDANTFVDAGAEWSWEKEKFHKIGSEVYEGKEIKRPFKMNNTPADLLEAAKREKVSSYCMAIRRDLFRYLGGFSPNLVSVEWSDADFCMNLHEWSYSVVSQGNSHVFRAAPKTTDRHEEYGRVYFRNKWVVSGRIDGIVKAKRPDPLPEVKNIVIRRRAAHGDVLIASGVASALRMKHPNAQIIFSTDCPEVLEKNPHIDKVVEVHSERWFDLYFDLDMAYEYRPDANIMQAYADACGVSAGDCELFLHTEPVEDELPEKYVAIHAGKTMWAGRNWSTIKFDQIAKRLKAAGFGVVCVGTWSDHKTTQCDLDLRGKTTIPQMAHVVKNASLFVGIDSFPMHAAQIFSTPGVAFFGSINPDTRLLHESSIRPVVAEGLKCLGCHHRKPRPCTATTTCEVGVQDCINNVSVDRVWQSIEPLLES